ncbi:MAG: hypothetical protein LBU85_10470 [Treponema sp.]|jgi:hypothetical protein|nr:hypothetical protein [Treponema sp.]
MSVPRPLPVFLSVLFAIGLWIYGAVRLQTDGGGQGGYAALICGEAYPDREIRELLDKQGLTGLVSESDQWFLLDCFGSVEKIPLVEYSQRLLPFDPRNDGYAEKLKNFFVRDGKRFVYIPLGINRPENLETEIARALAGISYSLEYAHPPSGRDIVLPLTAFCLTACVFFVIPVLRRRLGSGLLPCLLALSPLAFGLASGFALAALLAGFAALLAGPGRNLPSFSGMALSPDLPGPFTAKWLLAFALIASYCLFSFFSRLPVLFAFLVLASFCCTLALSIHSAGKTSIRFNVNKWYPRRGRFIPVEIISRNTASGGFSYAMLPFAVMAIALAAAGFAMSSAPLAPSDVNAVLPFTGGLLPSGQMPSGQQPDDALTEADFQEHVLFQTAFSFRALGKTYEAGGPPPVIAGYELSPNGLLDPAAPVIDEELQIPDFPLGDLLRGLRTDDSPQAAERVKRGNSAPVDLFLTLPPVLFILPALIYSIKKKTKLKSRRVSAVFSCRHVDF